MGGLHWQGDKVSSSSGFLVWKAIWVYKSKGGRVHNVVVYVSTYYASVCVCIGVFAGAYYFIVLFDVVVCVGLQGDYDLVYYGG